MKILIVDDSLFMRRLIKEAFKRVDAEVELVEFADSEAALAQVGMINPDLITLDLLMPKVTGIEFLSRLRQASNQTPVVVVTADVQKAVRQRCAELGVQHFIDKPITFEKLQAALTELLPA